ncbi:MAG: hypothetical protein ICV62_15005, partial [Cyanobacteria bacterium Co-bin13]|nr:hypothetical protein [Cyanobacteria bacterium Co-bin13]
GSLALNSDSAATCFKATSEGVSLESPAASPAPAPAAPPPNPATALQSEAGPKAEPIQETPEQAVFKPDDADPGQAAPEPTVERPAAEKPTAEIDQRQRQLSSLNHQIANLQASLAQEQQSHSTQRAEYAALAQKSRQQQQQIEDLEKQLDQLRAMATIGESFINRWQRQTYRGS